MARLRTDASLLVVGEEAVVPAAPHQGAGGMLIESCPRHSLARTAA